MAERNGATNNAALAEQEVAPQEAAQGQQERRPLTLAEIDARRAQAEADGEEFTEEQLQEHRKKPMPAHLAARLAKS